MVLPFKRFKFTMMTLAEVTRRAPARGDRQRRRHASFMLAVMGIVTAQLAWGCHLPQSAQSGSLSLAVTSVMAEEGAIRALIASAVCDTSNGPPAFGKTGQSSLCLHCTAGSENLRAARLLSPWAVAQPLMSEGLPVAKSPLAPWRAAVARGPPRPHPQSDRPLSEMGSV